MFGRASVILSLALLLTACSGDPETDLAGPAVEQTPVSGGTLAVAIGADPGQLNPAITTSGDVHTASELMYNGLVELTPGQEPGPELAESWEIEEDGALYRFDLRDGVTWHDGEPSPPRTSSTPSRRCC